MKLLLKILGIILGVIVLLILSFVVYVNVRGIPSYEANPPELTVKADSAMVAEGARIARLMCVNCHMGTDGKLSGSKMEDAPEFGELFTPNITHHPNSKLAPYSDGELAYLLRTGIKRDGNYAPPWMPKFPHLSEKDMHSIIGFLRSDDPILEPVDKIQPPPKPSFLAKALSNFVFKPLPYPASAIPEPDTTDMVAFGKYVATAKFDCYGCHSASFQGVDLMNPEKSVGFFGGGNALKNKAGETVLSPNLTMHDENGIGKWTEEEFIKAVRFGIRPNKPATAYPMFVFNEMTDKECAAIYAYLKSLPAIDNPALQ